MPSRWILIILVKVRRKIGDNYGAYEGQYVEKDADSYADFLKRYFTQKMREKDPDYSPVQPGDVSDFFGDTSESIKKWTDNQK